MNLEGITEVEVPLDLEGMTNAEAVAYYGNLTHDPISCGDLENLLEWAGLAKRNSVTGAWEGDLVSIMLDPPLGMEAIAEGLSELFSHLNKPRSVTVDTTSQPWAGKLDDLCNGLKAAGIIDQATHDDVLAFVGGLQYNLLDEEGVQAIRDEEARIAEEYRQNEKYGSLFNVHVSALMRGSNTDAEVAAGLRALADAYEA